MIGRVQWFCVEEMNNCTTLDKHHYMVEDRDKTKIPIQFNRDIIPDLFSACTQSVQFQRVIFFVHRAVEARQECDAKVVDLQEEVPRLRWFVLECDFFLRFFVPLF